jgi:hypothetical protein
MSEEKSMFGSVRQAAGHMKKSLGFSIMTGHLKNFEITSFHFVLIVITICFVDEQTFLGTFGQTQ